MKHEALKILSEIRDYSGESYTKGIEDSKITEFWEKDKHLRIAVNNSEKEHKKLRKEFSEELKLSETELCRLLQKDYVNFYPVKTRSPFIPLTAAGPWIVTTHGAVLHDSAGYGMLGLGHSSEKLLKALSYPWVMANVMTPQFSQIRLSERLKKEIGHKRGMCPFTKFICMNSGSEAISVASRICDINTKIQIEKGGRHEGKKVMQLALEDGFHGRTYRAAKVSDSTIDLYKEHLASFQKQKTLEVVPPNDLQALQEIFEKAEKNNVFFEAFYLEPVMGEGISGLAIDRKFYDLARKLTKAHGTIMIVDSIQAALRVYGTLSIIDYPGFEDCEAPDCETYSKALNAGQFPLSVLALKQEIADIYIPGVYGNTMTTNPRALEIGCEVLDSLTDSLRNNIVERGLELKNKLESLAEEFPEVITGVTGTGLIINAELDPVNCPVVADEGFEYYLRTHGINMIHGGDNGLRFTPHFAITSDEVDLIISTVRQGIIDLY